MEKIDHETYFNVYIFLIYNQVKYSMNTEVKISNQTFIILNKIIISILYNFLKKFNQIKDFNLTLQDICHESLLNISLSEISRTLSKFDNNISINQSITKKSGLTFSVSLVNKLIKNMCTKNFNPDDIFLIKITTFLEYITLEILEGSEKSHIESNKNEITPLHIFNSIIADDELVILIKKCEIIFIENEPKISCPQFDILQMNDFDFVKSTYDQKLEDENIAYNSEFFLEEYVNRNFQEEKFSSG